MTHISDKFERQIQRIHQFLEEGDAKVTWNDRIPDPDNPEQPRQIDVTIRKDNKLTLVECRLHKSKQDVKWIEELIGRRTSLNANAVIAVSASGFTTGAIRKAEKFGIILRDVLSLTEEEIRSWGHKTKVWLTFYEYSDVHMTFVYNESAKSQITAQDIINHLSSHNGIFYMYIERISQELDKNNIQKDKASLDVTLHPRDQINGITPDRLHFMASVRAKKKELQIPSIVVYDQPDVNALERNVFVEAVEMGEFEITQSSNDVMVTLDLTPVTPPANCHFRFVTFDFQRPVRMRAMQVLGLPNPSISIHQIRVKLIFTKQ